MEKISLNFDWQFSYNGLTKNVHLPHPGVELPISNFNIDDLLKQFTYEKTIEFVDEDMNKHLSLRFEGIHHIACVYFNDELIHVHRGGYTPFEFEIKPIVGQNKLKVLVDSRENPSIPPFGGIVDYLGYAGIYREVYLIKRPKNHIINIHVKYENTLENDDVKFQIKTNATKGVLNASIYDQDENMVLCNDEIVTDYETEIQFHIPNKKLWAIESPYLYTLKLEYEGATYFERFGFRDAVFKNDGFYLNGKKTKLMGLNRHQSYPYVGNAMPKGAQREDADLLKSLGLNMVRTAHYPQSTHFLNRCDEIGLLVFTEIPGWQHIGDEEWQAESLKNLESMIVRDRNHPSVVLWGVRINESNDHHDFYQKTNDLARRLDPMRQTGGVRNIQHSEFLEDVYTYNDFYHEGNNRGLLRKKQVIKDAPYLVSEYNGHMYPTKTYDDEPKRIEHAKRHLNVLNQMKDPNNKLSGSIGWCFSDYQTHNEFGSGDGICHHGVLDIYRNHKIASYVYMAEGSKEVVMHVSSNLIMGDYPKGNLNEVYVFTNVDYIKLYRNAKYVKTFYPSKNKYKYLKHPPIIIDDFIGELIEKNEGFSVKDSEIAKKILKDVQNYGTKMPLKTKLRVLYILRKYKLTMDQGVSLFYKYLSNWGSKQSDYRFDGYINDHFVKSVTKSMYRTFDYELIPTRKVLNIGDTYDSTRVVIKKVDQNSEIAPYAFDPVEIYVENLELVGPKLQSLNNGLLAFWVKTINPGTGKIVVKINDKFYETEVEVYES